MFAMLVFFTLRRNKTSNFVKQQIKHDIIATANQCENFFTLSITLSVRSDAP